MRWPGKRFRFSGFFDQEMPMAAGPAGPRKRERLPERALGGVHVTPALTYSRAWRTTIGPGRLTAVFGMGTGVAARVCAPGRRAVYEQGSGSVASLPARVGGGGQCGEAFGC